MTDLHHEAWETAVHLYLNGDYDLYDDNDEFKNVVNIAAEIVVRLLAFHPAGPPLSLLDHTVRRIQTTADAALVQHRGQFDVTQLLEDGWTWADGEEHIAGKRLRWLVPPGKE